jgi:hypothetical protein
MKAAIMNSGISRDLADIINHSNAGVDKLLDI